MEEDCSRFRLRTLVLLITGLASQSESYQTLPFFLCDVQGPVEQQTTGAFLQSRRSLLPPQAENAASHWGLEGTWG